MPSLEGGVHLPLNVVDPFGLHGRRQNPDLHSTFKIFPVTHLHHRYVGQEASQFSLVIPHISRIRSLMILAGAIPDLLRHFRCHPPLLEELDINITLLPTLTIDNAMFGGDLSPLRRLTLIGVVTHLPWRNMANLTVFKLHCPLMYEVAVTRILDFFESVPLLNTVDVTNSIPDSSDAPPGRTVSLRHLKTLSIATGPVHSTLSHLRIPIERPHSYPTSQKHRSIY